MVEKSKNTIWCKDFILLLILNGANGMSFQIIAPNLPVFAKQLGFAESLIGILAASLAFGALLSRFFVGVIVDRMNRRKLSMISLFLTSVTIIALEWASTPLTLIGIRFIGGLLFGLNSTVTMTIAACITPEEKMGQVIGVMGVTGVGSQAIGPAIGLFIVGRWDFSGLFLFTSVIALVIAPLSLAVKETQLPGRSGESGVLKKRFSIRDLIVPDIVAFSLIGLLVCSANSAINNFIILYGLAKGIGNVGFYFTVCACVIIATRFLGGFLTDKYPFQWIVYPCSALFIIALVLLSNAVSILMIVSAAVLVGMAHGITVPTLQASGIRLVESSRRGAAVATSYIGFDSAQMLGPIIMGSVVQAAGFKAGFLSLCIPVVAAAPLIAFQTRKLRSIQASSV